MISEFVEYVKQAWKNKPNASSPLNADRLNHMEDGIENNSNKIKEIAPAVNELTENITKLKENKWQLFGTRTGSNSINIKELIQTGKEIRVIVEAQYSSSSVNRIKLVYNPSPENIGIFTSGYCYSSNNYVTVAITINADGMVYIASFWWKVMENANTTIPLNDTTATLKVYYR